MRADDLGRPLARRRRERGGTSLRRQARAAGEAIRISTGAIMPDGDGSRAAAGERHARRRRPVAQRRRRAERSPHPPRGVRFPRGDDHVLPAGTRIGPAQLALALAAGHGELPVRACPRSRCSTAATSWPPTRPLARRTRFRPATARCSPRWPRRTRRRSLRLGPVPDRLEAMLAALDEAADTDVIVTSGGASVGDHDLVRPALEQWGATIDFWRVAMRPGKPLLVARSGRQWVARAAGQSGFELRHRVPVPAAAAARARRRELTRCPARWRCRLGPPLAASRQPDRVRPRATRGRLAGRRSPNRTAARCARSPAPTR